MSKKADLIHRAHQAERSSRSIRLSRYQYAIDGPVVPTLGTLAVEKALKVQEAEYDHVADQCWDEVQAIADTERAERGDPPEEPYWRGGF